MFVVATKKFCVIKISKCVYIKLNLTPKPLQSVNILSILLKQTCMILYNYRIKAPKGVYIRWNLLRQNLTILQVDLLTPFLKKYLYTDSFKQLSKLANHMHKQCNA